MKENLKALGLAAVFFVLTLLCLWGALLLAKDLEDRSIECESKGGEMLYNRCVETIELERKTNK